MKCEVPGIEPRSCGAGSQQCYRYTNLTVENTWNRTKYLRPVAALCLPLHQSSYILRSPWNRTKEQGIVNSLCYRYTNFAWKVPGIEPGITAFEMRHVTVAPTFLLHYFGPGRNRTLHLPDLESVCATITPQVQTTVVLVIGPQHY